jgi:hypothetical protein
VSRQVGSIVKTCPVCGAEFHCSPSREREGKGKYCSKACGGKANRKPLPGHVAERKAANHA